MAIQLGAGTFTKLSGVFRRMAVARAYGATFDTEMGRVVLDDILRRAGVLRTSFDVRPGMTEWQEGRRSMALEILRQINMDERDFARLTADMTEDDRVSADE